MFRKIIVILAIMLLVSPVMAAEYEAVADQEGKYVDSKDVRVKETVTSTVVHEEVNSVRDLEEERDEMMARCNARKAIFDAKIAAMQKEADKVTLKEKE